MLFPISDDDRKISGPALVTKGLILANLVVFFLLQQGGANEAFTSGFSVIPAEITTGTDITASQTVQVDGESIPIPQAPGPTPIYLTIFTAMFMHAGLLHLFGNLLYLWIFGDNVEHRFGSGAFLLFYLASGITATFAQVWLGPDSIIPNLGASGAISGVLGAYLILFPRNRVHALLFYFVVSVPAIVAIGMWIVFQFLNGYGAFIASQQTGGVAYGAHIGGFFAGIVLAMILRVIIRKPERPNVFARASEHDHSRQYW
jgi:membrane associated rhomboid family serine protease